MTGSFRVGDWEVFPDTGVLQSAEQEIQLEPRAMELLVYFAQHAEQVLSKKLLIQAVWTDAFVADDVLTSAIWKLRQALGDDPKQPAYIKTLPRRGYQFVAEVDIPDDLRPQPDKSDKPIVEIRPYPGLSSFTLAQSEYFFGREMEVESMWKKLERSSLLGLIGPSGSGKSSFLRAGVTPAAPAGWGVVIATPGKGPFLGLAQGFFEEFSGEPEFARQLLRFENPEVAEQLVSHWRARHSEVVIILDQFEELFILNPQETQENFISLLGRLLNEVGVHVLLSMRDDFLFRCHGFKILEPVFLDLTPIGSPAGRALKRALVEPAERCGYRFEDEALVDEMLQAVQSERGALPLLAFTAAQLWERRDRQSEQLSRKSYEVIGGVVGALAAHAEETLEKIGREQIPLVRELFRNLTTGQGTRSVQDREELLSVFASDQRDGAAQVLEALINSRLLVSFQAPSVSEEGEGEYRIEIVHESLLENWPRLKRWQAQDAQGAQLRDELRQAARIWDQHGRSADYLWTGMAYQEYEIWRDQYPGGLTGLEESFGRASADQAQRKRKRSRYATAAVIIFLLIGIAAITVLWRKAVDEARRADAASLLSLARLDPEMDPTSAIAYATASLETYDTEAARHFVTRILTQGPVAFSSRPLETDPISLNFSHDGKWLVAGGHNGFHQVWPSDGSPPIRLSAHGEDGVYWNAFSQDGRFMVSAARQGQDPKAVVWETDRFTVVKEVPLGPEGQVFRDYRQNDWLHPLGIPLFREEMEGGFRVRLVPFEGGEVNDLGLWPRAGVAGEYRFGLESSQLLRQVDDRELYITTGLPHQPVDRKFGEVEQNVSLQFLSADRALSWLWDDPSKEMSIWSLNGESNQPLRTFSGPEVIANQCGIDREGRWLAVPEGSLNRAAIWSLTGPVCRGPQILRRGDRGSWSIAVHPEGSWVAVSDQNAVSLWPLRDTYPSVLFESEKWVMGVAIDPDGEWVAASTSDGLKAWSLKSTGKEEPRLLYPVREWNMLGPVVSKDGGTLVYRVGRTLVVLPVNGGTPREIPFDGFPLVGANGAVGIAIDDGGSKVALLVRTRIKLWDLETGETQILEAADGKDMFTMQFVSDGQLVTSGHGGFRSWDLTTGDSEVLIPDRVGLISPDGRYAVGSILDSERVKHDTMVFDLETGDSWKLPSFDGLRRGVWHPSSRALIGSDLEGTIRVAPIDGGPAHLLYGHSNWAAVSVDRSGKWIASASQFDGTVRLWSMPDLSKPPFHTLPHDELIERLKSMTNYRAVKDESSPSGYKIEYGPLPGWEKVPEW